jgi:hypothetical protein
MKINLVWYNGKSIQTGHSPVSSQRARELAAVADLILSVRLYRMFQYECFSKEAIRQV